MHPSALAELFKENILYIWKYVNADKIALPTHIFVVAREQIFGDPRKIFPYADFATGSN